MRSIWAVAKNTVKQALRMKIAVVFIILLLVLLPVIGITTTGDETLKGRLQTFVSYGLSLTGLLLCLLTIIVSVYTVTSDIKYRQIYTVITKPIRRFQFLLGKLLGIILLDVALLVLFSSFIYIFAMYMPNGPL
jgi:ABC-type transport system involved in multi-copper enzyme maturation permease subunit